MSVMNDGHRSVNELQQLHMSSAHDSIRLTAAAATQLLICDVLVLFYVKVIVIVSFLSDSFSYY